MNKQAARLYGAPSFIPGEAMSSWIYRIAAHFRYTPTGIARMMWRPRPPHELDFLAITPDLDEMAWVTNSDAEPLKHSYPRPSRIAALLARGATETPTRFEQITRTSALRPIYRICTACLQQDETPHVRLAWRLASTTYCPTHECLLLDRCAECHARLSLTGHEPIRTTMAMRRDVIRYCRRCKSNFTHRPIYKVPPTFLRALRDIQTTMSDFVFGDARDRFSALKTCITRDSLQRQIYRIHWENFVEPKYHGLFFRWLSSKLDTFPTEFEKPRRKTRVSGW
jgi:hypothetical protein